MARRRSSDPQPEFSGGSMPPAPPGYAPQAQPGYVLPPGYVVTKKKPFYKRVWFWLLMVVVLIIVIVVASIASAAHDATSKPHAVVYSVTGTVGTADITYYSNDGSSHSQSISADKQKLPWTKSITVKGDFSLMSVTASTTQLGKSGTLSCTLTIDGNVAATDKSTGTVGLVSCAGTGYDGK